jgi:carboxyl-terminal processing protease
MQLSHLRRQIAALALAVTAVFASAQGTAPQPTTPQAFTPEVRAEILKKMSEYITERAFVPGVDFGKWGDLLAKHQESIQKAETHEEFTRAVNRALREFEFSHIVLISPRSMQARVQRQGIGVGVQIVPQPDGLLVTRVVTGAPAAEAGIVPGDTILEADGKKADGPEALRGDEGAAIVLKVRRADGSIREFQMVRRKFDTTVPEELKWHDAETAVLRIPTFDISYNSRRVETLVAEAAAKAKNLVIDLRGNGGGVVANVLHLLGLVLPPETQIGTFVNRQHAKNWVAKGGDINDLKGMAENANAKLSVRPRRNATPFKGKLAVLVDGGSGSASEIAAAALRETIGAPVIGSKSAGAVLASVMMPVGGGFSLQYPIFDYVTVKGVRLEGNGVVPDATAPTPAFLPQGAKDPGVESALSLLSKASSGQLR